MGRCDNACCLCDAIERCQCWCLWLWFFLMLAVPATLWILYEIYV